MESNCVLIVDDEFLIADTLSSMIEDLGMPVCGTAGNAQEALALAEEHSPQLVLMDVRIDGPRDGVDAANAIRAKIDTRVIFITGSREPQTVTRIEQDHPDAILFKPITFAHLREAVRRVAGGV